MHTQSTLTSTFPKRSGHANVETHHLSSDPKEEEEETKKVWPAHGRHGMPRHRGRGGGLGGGCCLGVVVGHGVADEVGDAGGDGAVGGGGGEGDVDEPEQHEEGGEAIPV